MPAAALSLLGFGFELVKRTGAVPASEFPPAVIAYRLSPWLLYGGFAAAILASLPLLKTKASLAAAAAFALIAWGGVFETPWQPTLYPLGIGGLCVVTWILQSIRQGDDPDRSIALARALRHIEPIRQIERGLIVAAVVTAVPAGLLLLESFIALQGWVPRLLPEETLAAHRSLVLPLSLGTGIQAGIGVVLALMALPLASRFLLANPDSPSRLAVIDRTGLLLGLPATAIALMVLADSLGSELIELRVLETVIAISLIGGLGFASLHGRAARRFWTAGSREIERLRWAGIALRAGATGVAGLVPAGRSASMAVFVLLCLGASTAILPALFPSIEDYRVEALPFYGSLLIILLTWVVVLFLRLRVPRAASAILASTILAISAWQLPALRDHKELGHVHVEMSRMGRLLRSAPAISLLAPFPHLGAEAGPEPWPVEIPTTPSRGDRRKLPPVIFLLWDAARPDRLSTSGRKRDATPNLRRIAQECVIFDQARSNSTATTHGTRSLLSGNYASRHMLGRKHPPFLTQWLALSGYDRFLVTVAGTDYNGVSLEAFQRNWTASPEHEIEWDGLYVDPEGPEKGDAWKTEHTILALRRHARSRPGLEGFFAYIHLTGPHYPWKDTRFGDTPADRYDGELAAVDELLGDLESTLRDLGVWEQALFVVTADHGTALGEHGRLAGFLTYEEQVRIPLLIKYPGIEPKRIREHVFGIDAVPTILDLIHGERPAAFHGTSLLPLMLGERESLPPRLVVTSCAFRDTYAIYDEEYRWKLHHHRGERYEVLYDLAEDPDETRNLIGTREDIAARLRDRLNHWLWIGASTFATPRHY